MHYQRLSLQAGEGSKNLRNMDCGMILKTTICCSAGRKFKTLSLRETSPTSWKQWASVPMMSGLHESVVNQGSICQMTPDFVEAVLKSPRKMVPGRRLVDGRSSANKFHSKKIIPQRKDMITPHWTRDFDMHVFSFQW